MHQARDIKGPRTRHRRRRIDREAPPNHTQCALRLSLSLHANHLNLLSLSLTVIKSGTAEGLSLSSYVFETLSYGITLAYSHTSQFPFSTYGENFFLTLQNLVISLLIIATSSGADPSSTNPDASPFLPISSLALLTILLGGLSALPLAPLPLLAQLQLFLALPLSLLSKLAQIQSNFRAQSTGQLSSFAVFAQLLGGAVRIYTSLAEVGDLAVAAGFIGAFVLNLVLIAQVYTYYGQYPRRPLGEGKKATTNKKEEKPVKSADEKKKKDTLPVPEAAPVARPVTPQADRVSAYDAPERTASPVRRVATPTGGSRKWARKVD